MDRPVRNPVPLALHCHACGHVWPALFMPIRAERFPQRFQCPYCHEVKRLFVADEAATATLPPPVFLPVVDVAAAASPTEGRAA